MCFYKDLSGVKERVFVLANRLIVVVANRLYHYDKTRVAHYRRCQARVNNNPMWAIELFLAGKDQMEIN